MPKHGIPLSNVQYHHRTEYSTHPISAALEYAEQPGVPLVVRTLCALAAAQGGTGDGTLLGLGHEWAHRMEAMLSDDFPGIDVAATLRTHLTGNGVCRVYFDESDLPQPERGRRPSARAANRVPLSAQASLAVFARDGYRCVVCASMHDLTVDHIVPVVRGGTNADDNLQTLCRSCNSRKGARQ